MDQQDKQILKNLETRLKTIMIGGLSRFEDSFGYLWNIDGDPQNDHQKYMSDRWEQTRTDLLNHGNRQIRQALDELVDFIEHKNKFSYNYQFIIKDQNKNRS